MTELLVRDLRVVAGRQALVDGASLGLRAGELVALLGPNGAGKTSLLRASLGLARAAAGRVTLDGRDIARYRAAERARRVAYLPQSRPLAWPARVRDVVALGRFAHGASPGRLRDADAAAVERAIEDCDLAALALRRVDTLSGGELARTHCARAFASGAPLLVADEPTAALDPRQQLRVLDLVERFVESGGGALVVLHEVGLAARCATRLVWMKAGRIVADGSVADTLDADRVAEVYGVRARIDGRAVAIEGLA